MHFSGLRHEYFAWKKYIHTPTHLKTTVENDQQCNAIKSSLKRPLCIFFLFEAIKNIRLHNFVWT